MIATFDAFSDERARDGEADAARSAGDERDLPAQGSMLIAAITIAHAMLDVAIIGAGELGGALAHALARRDFAARRSGSIDETGRVAAGKALDIAQAAPIEGFATQVSGATDVCAAAGAPIDRRWPIAPAAPEWHGDEGLLLLRQLIAPAPRASIVLCAGAAHRELVERGVARARHFRRGRACSDRRRTRSRPRCGRWSRSNRTDRRATSRCRSSACRPTQIVVPWDEAAIGGFARDAGSSTSLRDGGWRRDCGAVAAGSYALAPPRAT